MASYDWPPIGGGGGSGNVSISKNSGATIGSQPKLNLIEGSNVTLTIADDPGNSEVDITIASTGGAGGYATVQEEGVSLTQRSNINFIGAGVTAADDAANSRTNVTLDATLNSLAAYNTNGLITQTAADTFTGRTLTGTANQVTVTNGNGVSGNPTVSLDTRILTQSFTIIVGDRVNAITAGTIGCYEVPFACTITKVTLLADQTGSIVIDIKKSSYASYPTTSSIVASAPPTLSSAQKYQDSTLTGWTTAISAGDILEWSVTSASTVTQVAICITATK